MMIIAKVVLIVVLAVVKVSFIQLYSESIVAWKSFDKIIYQMNSSEYNATLKDELSWNYTAP